MTNIPTHIRRVLVATPTHDGRIDARYAMSLIDTMRQVPPDVAIDVKFICGDTLLIRARDTLLQFAVDMCADELVWIDADTYWKPADFMRLIDSPHAYIGGIQRLKQDKPVVPLRLLPGYLPDSEGIIRIRGIGFGMTRMAKECFTQLHAAGQPYESQGRHLRRVFDMPIVAGQMIGEDFTVCEAWRDMGHDVYADTRIKLGHVADSAIYDFEGLDEPTYPA
jgi:hypothetical protein